MIESTAPYPDDGHVEPGGAWLDRVDGGLAVRKLSVGEMDNNVYVLQCRETGEALVVDAADAAPRIREALADVEPVAVVQTHGHWDHVRAWGELVDDPGLPVWGHAGDAELFPNDVDLELADGEILQVGELEVEVLHVPGHTPGSLLFLVHGAERPHLMSGDSLFPGGPGRTTNPDEFTQIMDGLQAKVFDRLPDSTWIYPGHGDDSTIGAERPSIPEWRERGW